MNWTHSELLRRGPTVPRPLQLKLALSERPIHWPSLLLRIGYGLFSLRRFFVQDRQLFERGALASGRIVRRRRGQNRFQTEVVFKVDGVERKVSTENVITRWSGSDYADGGTVAVFYDPVRPHRFALYGAGFFDIQRGGVR